MSESTKQYDWRERPVGSLKGVGPEMAEKLARLDIVTAGDLIRHFPRRYEDYSQIVAIRDMRPGTVTFRGKVERVSARYARARKLHITEAIISDDTGTVKAIWFNQSFLAKTIPKDTPVLVSGELKFRNNDLAMQSPTIERDEEGVITRETARILPVYPETEGLSSRQLRRVMDAVQPLVGAVDETMPEEVVGACGLMSYSEALREIHWPADAGTLERARHRLAFEELWLLMLANLATKRELQSEIGVGVEFSADVAKGTIAALGFELTDGQRKSAWEILQDMVETRPMNRLLQGDVGSGKTAVAVMAAVMALAGGRQVAIMAPTEVLARQHAANLEPVLAALGFGVGLLLGRTAAADKRALAARLAAGEPLLVIGTQALLTDNVGFADLALVIIDEQHRFGVGQRQNLKAKSGWLPHLLTMTATPIPRTLQLTVYGDLDVSVIEGMPPGRRPVITKVIDAVHRDEAYALINEQLDHGHQAFVVCPLIEDSAALSDPGGLGGSGGAEAAGVRSVTAEVARLAKGPLKNRRVGLMHGRLSADEKQAVMDDFVAGRLDVLVATTVIEVGVDVPNATVMLVEGAERFGLAALHQLRGRVGRAAHQSYCLLATTQRGQAADRLRALERTNDGFRLAQIDLEIRGPGQIYGRRQHGALDLRLADISDAKLLADVRNSADAFLSDPALVVKYPQIMARVAALQTITSLD